MPRAKLCEMPVQGVLSSLLRNMFASGSGQNFDKAAKIVTG
jgi:hypothetical protein